MFDGRERENFSSALPVPKVVEARLSKDRAGLRISLFGLEPAPNAKHCTCVAGVCNKGGVEVSVRFECKKGGGCQPERGVRSSVPMVERERKLMNSSITRNLFLLRKT